MKTKEIKEKIKFLNGLIAHLKAASSVSMVGCKGAESKARKMQGAIMKELTNKGFSNDIIEAINCIDFSGLNHKEPDKVNYYHSISEMINSCSGCTPQGEQAYYHSMQKMVDILIDYRDSLKEEMDMPTKMWTLIFSAIAAVGAILSFIL